jgi:hypothetical protein
MSRKAKKSHDSVERIATTPADGPRTGKQPYTSEEEAYGGEGIKSPKTESDQSGRTQRRRQNPGSP